LWFIPASITLVLFPTFSGRIFSSPKKKEVEFFFIKSINMIILVVFPIAFSVGIFSEEILHFWINQNFAEHSGLVMQIFTVGVIINSIAQVPFTLIQSAGHSKLIAIINMIQFPFFMATLYFSTKIYGIEGASFAWLFRLIVDAIMMFYAIRFVSADFKKIRPPKLLMLKIMLFILIFYVSCSMSVIFKFLAVFILSSISLLLIFRARLHKLTNSHF